MYSIAPSPGWSARPQQPQTHTLGPRTEDQAYHVRLMEPRIQVDYWEKEVRCSGGWRGQSQSESSREMAAMPKPRTELDAEAGWPLTRTKVNLNVGAHETSQRTWMKWIERQGARHLCPSNFSSFTRGDLSLSFSVMCRWAQGVWNLRWGLEGSTHSYH